MLLKNRVRYIKDYFNFKKIGGYVSKIYPIYNDYEDQAGSATGHYFHQDLLVANYIFKNNPLRHIDVGSRVDGFVAHVASFRKIEIIDVRDLKSTGHENIKFTKMDLMDEAAVEHEICDSISCLHAIEHFGLGRYGDPLDPNGHIKGFINILKMLKTGGTFYISFPIAKSDRVEFNAHRVFASESIFKWQSTYQLKLKHFSFVDDQGDLHIDVATHEIPKNLKHGCGIYVFEKL
jgi:hypothetical protein